MMWHYGLRNSTSNFYSAIEIDRREGKNPKGGTGRFMSDAKKASARRKRK